MQAVQAGEVELFDLLVRRYRPPLIHVAWSKLGDWNWAEDVVQESFLAAFASRQSYNPVFSFRTWIWTIVLNNCRREWQKRASRPQEISIPQSSTDWQRIGTEPALPDTPLSQLLRVEQRTQVYQLLSQLPEAQADALRLRFFGGLQFSEIAQAMESSLGGAKQRVKNGLLALAKLVSQKEGESS